MILKGFKTSLESNNILSTFKVFLKNELAFSVVNGIHVIQDGKSDNNHRHQDSIQY